MGDLEKERAVNAMLELNDVLDWTQGGVKEKVLERECRRETIFASVNASSPCTETGGRESENHTVPRAFLLEASVSLSHKSQAEEPVCTSTPSKKRIA